MGSNMEPEGFENPAGLNAEFYHCAQVTRAVCWFCLFVNSYTVVCYAMTKAVDGIGLQPSFTGSTP